MSLANRVDSFPESWRPSEGDKLVGEITGLATSDGGFGPYTVVDVFVEDDSTEAGQPIGIGEERAWHAFDTVAKNELAKQKPQIGDGIAAKYFGKKTGRDGATEYKALRVIVERRGARIDEATADEAGVSTPPDQDDDIPF
jgi:hypothetical protein